VDPPSVGATVGSFARSFCANPNWGRQRNAVLVTTPRRQTAATLPPGRSASITIASLSPSVKLRRFERLLCGDFALRAAFKSFSGRRMLNTKFSRHQSKAWTSPLPQLTR
jgi:hypothetical protein